MQRYEVKDCLPGLDKLQGRGFDWDKVGHFTIAFVIDSEHLSSAIKRRVLPQGATYINQSDKRHTVTVFLSPRPAIAMKKRLLLTHILKVCYCEEQNALAGFVAFLTSAAHSHCDLAQCCYWGSLLGARQMRCALEDAEFKESQVWSEGNINERDSYMEYHSRFFQISCCKMQGKPR